jgi:FkbM family methyltransferase
VTVHQIGLAEASQSFDLHVNAFAPTNSLLETDPSADLTWGAGILDTQRKLSCQFSTLDAFANELGINRINLLKLDVQGAEEKVFAGGSKSLAAGLIDVIYMEIIVMPTYKGQSRIGEYFELLQSYGMSLHGIYNLSHVSGRLRQLDAIFVRSD